jgi:signal transduction histidine kinase
MLCSGLIAQFGHQWPPVWLSIASTTLVMDLISAVLINAAISMSGAGGRVFSQVVGPGSVFILANTAIGLIAVMLLPVHTYGLVLLAAPTATSFLAGQAYASIRQKHGEVVALQRATSLAEMTSDVGQTLPALLEHVRGMFNADVAEIVLWPTEDDRRFLAIQLGPGQERADLHPVSPVAEEGVWARVAAEREGVVLPRPIRNPALAEHFAQRGIHDAMVVPMLADGEVTGSLMVANREGEFATFDAGDLRLLQVLGNHVSVSVRNARLFARLGRALEHERLLAQMKDDFVATISHELRTPLTNVKGYIKTLCNPDVVLSDTEREEFLASADRQAERLSTLIEDLLFDSFEHGPSDTRVLDRSPAAALIERIALDRAGPARSARMEVSVPATLPEVEVSREELARVIGNLVDNALKYSPEGSKVRVEARSESVGIRVSVIDRGAGIPVAEHKRIFERFYQIEQGSTRRRGGAGLGLFICRRAAEEIGARVWLEGSDATGSTFCVWLPLQPTRKAIVQPPAPRLEPVA